MTTENGDHDSSYAMPMVEGSISESNDVDATIIEEHDLKTGPSSDPPTSTSLDTSTLREGSISRAEQHPPYAPILSKTQSAGTDSNKESQPPSDSLEEEAPTPAPFLLDRYDLEPDVLAALMTRIDTVSDDSLNKDQRNLVKNIIEQAFDQDELMERLSTGSFEVELQKIVREYVALMMMHTAMHEYNKQDGDDGTRGPPMVGSFRLPPPPAPELSSSANHNCKCSGHH